MILSAKTPPILAFASLLLLVVACGGEETATPPPSVSPAPPAAVPEPEPEPEPEPPGALLRVRVAAGNSFEFQESTTIDTEGTMQGMDIGSQIVINAAYTYDIVSVDDAGVADVNVTFGRVHGSLTSAMLGEIPFDSEAEDEPDPMTAMATGQFLARAGATFQVMIDARGRMSDFRGIDAIVEKMAAASPMAAAMQGGTEGIAREFRRQTTEQLIPFPEERALPNIPWSDSSELALGPLVMVLRHETTLGEEVDGGLQLARETGIDTPEDGDTDPVAAQLGLEELTSSSAAVVGKDDGLPLRIDGTLLMRLNPGGQGAMTQSFTRKVERVVD